MAIRIGLMGFGRIGRNIFRILHGREDIQLMAISEIADHQGLEYLIKYDTLMGRFEDEVSVRDGYLYAAGRRIRMLSGKEPGDVDWAEHGVDIVIEATGRYRSREELKRHLAAGAKRVLLCVPPVDEPDVTVVMGLNHKSVMPEHRIISNASATAHCAAPIIQLVHDAFEIERMYFTTVHAYTNDQRLADVPADDLRRSRAASENIIPTETNASSVMMNLLPALAGKISGIALKVPVPNGSLVDMTFFTRGALSKDAINEVVRTGVSNRYKPYVEFTRDPIVSSDVKRSAYSSTFDSLATLVNGDHVAKCVAWFDNGWGYAHRVVELAQHVSSLEEDFA